MSEGFKLNRWGIFLHRLHLLDWWVVPQKYSVTPTEFDQTEHNFPKVEGQIIYEPYFTVRWYWEKFRQFWCIHHYETLYRIPKDGEQFIPRPIGMLGTIEDEHETCEWCHKWRRKQTLHTK